MCSICMAMLPHGFCHPIFTLQDKNTEIITQRKQKYAAITIKDTMKAPFVIIPNAYKNANGIHECEWFGA